jgi:hypothetical protein
MTASTMIRRLHEIPIPVSFADDTYADSLTKWSVALELNPDDLGKSELFGVLVSVAMSMMLQGKTEEHFADWYQFSWAASEKLGRSNKRGKSNILQLTGTPRPDRVDKVLEQVWIAAEHHHRAKVLSDVSALRQQLEEHTRGSSGGRPRSDALLRTFDDMVAERQRLNQEEFTYPCRPAGERLGIHHKNVCSRLRRLVDLGIVVQVERGQLKGLDGEGFAHASRYQFAAPTTPAATPDKESSTPFAMGGAVSNPKSPPAKPPKAKPPCKLPLKVMKRIDLAIGLSYQTVLDHGGDVTHWKRWLRHLDRHRLDSQEARYRWVVAKNDPQGSVAVEAHQRRQELETHEFLNRADPGAADRKRMVAAMKAHGSPTGSKVTVSLVFVPGDHEWDGWQERYRFATECPVVEQMLASLGDVMGMLRAESAIRLMEAYGVLVDREYLS